MIALLSLTAWAAPVTVVGSLTREAALAPGEASRGAVVLRNNTDAPLPVSIYERDYHFRADGQNFFDVPGSLERSNAGWIDFTPAHLVIPAGATASVSYVMQAPKEAVASGTYWSALMVEPAPSVAEDAGPETGVQIRTVFRYAVQMVTHIGAADPHVVFAPPRLEVVDGRRFLTVELANDGAAWVTPRVWADLYAATGGQAQRLEASATRLYPGCSARSRIDVTHLPADTYTALVIADGGAEVVGAQYTLELR